MRLRRLELYGYKSFASRCAFDLSEGLTAIVGPNGSGKSNIADAIRWVLGEQSYRSLRARTTGDMIFAGGRNRSRLGMAEVILTLDNSEGWLPVDYTEVTVGRRAYRSGENEYVLNGDQVRYRDLLHILGAGGLSNSTYTVIGQGLVDAALALRPEARRSLFEEAAGIAPQLRNRADALRRIEETERNIQRADDILNELRPRATRLRQQAERAEEHLLLRQDLQELERIWYGYHWQRQQAELVHVERHTSEKKTQLEAQARYARTLEERQDQIGARQSDVRQTLEALDHEALSFRDEIESLKREKAIEEERTRLRRQQEKSLEAEIRTLGSRLDILQHEIDQATQELDEQDAVRITKALELDSARKILGEVNKSRSAVQAELEAQTDHLAQVRSDITGLRGNLQQLDERRQRLAGEREEAATRSLNIAKRLQRLEPLAEELRTRERQLAQKQTALQQEQGEIETEIEAARSRLADFEDSLAKTRAEHSRLTARRQALARLRQDLTGYHPGVREVLASRNSLSGIVGTVASLVEVPKELEGAIESALGSRLQNIITDHWEDAERAIAHLKRTRTGWATFLPLDTLRPRLELDLVSDAGVLGVASKLVGFEERLRPALVQLLGRVVIVRDLPAARRLLQRRAGASLIVTLEGETVQPSGVLSGGIRKGEAVLLTQEREWRELAERVATVAAQVEQETKDRATQRDRLSGLQREAEQRQRQLVLLRTERDVAIEDLTSHTQDVREFERDRQRQASRLIQLKSEMQEVDDLGRGLHSKLTEAQANQAATDTCRRRIQQKLTVTDDEGPRRRVAELETHLAVAQRTVESQHRLLGTHQSNAAQVREQIEGKQTQRHDLCAALMDLGRAREITDARLGTLAAQIIALQEAIAPAREELASLAREQQETERQHSQSLDRLRESENDYNRSLLDRDRIRDRQATLSRDIEAQLGPIDLPNTSSRQLRLSLDDFIIELPDVATLPPGLEEDIRHLKARLGRLGGINPEAPREYEQLLERQTFLQGQIADLRGAIASLHEVVHELDRIIEGDFSSTVKTVDAAFSDYFRALFDGGGAHLLLTDPDSLSTTGVDIMVHPPGKRPQRLSLLSGGERALTAVALLFALLKANPVPFCILDEVDAALDETNVGRFRDLLVAHAQTTQFIVITHNRHTIEAAALIYGISMNEQGVSQSVSLMVEQ